LEEVREILVVSVLIDRSTTVLALIGMVHGSVDGRWRGGLNNELPRDGNAMRRAVGAHDTTALSVVAGLALKLDSRAWWMNAIKLHQQPHALILSEHNAKHRNVDRAHKQSQFSVKREKGRGYHVPAVMFSIPKGELSAADWTVGYLRIRLPRRKNDFAGATSSSVETGLGRI
jgi:hypothetical protein